MPDDQILPFAPTAAPEPPGTSEPPDAPVADAPAVAQAPPPPLQLTPAVDATGIRVAVGDILLPVANADPVYFRVAACEPELAPNVPAGMMRLTLHAQVQALVGRGAVMPFVRVAVPRTDITEEDQHVQDRRIILADALPPSPRKV